MQVIDVLRASGSCWDRILEPTCGIGNFINGIANSPVLTRNGQIQGIEIQPMHYQRAVEIQKRHRNLDINLINANIFDLNLGTDLLWQNQGRLLVIGNPPWITNSELGSLASENLPEKRNLKGLRGLDALTGESNFDLAEYIWLKIIQELAEEQPTIALLCKTATARNIIQYAARAKLPISDAQIRKIDARLWFDVAVDACLFIIQIGSHFNLESIPVFPDLTGTQPEQTLGLFDGLLVNAPEIYGQIAAIEGSFPLTWRQGIKHDAADVMELSRHSDGSLWNKMGDPVDVEGAYVYPLLKSSDLSNGRTTRANRAVIVPQQLIGQDTTGLQFSAPLLWDYLKRHEAIFRRRKSSIYVGKPPFSIFGIGPYAFAPFKVAVSGLYKLPRFAAVGTLDGRPVIFDDTCYFVSCESAPQCAALAALLNSPACQRFLAATTFIDAKRPITKKLLQRIHLPALLNAVEPDLLLEETRRIMKQIAPENDEQTMPDADQLMRALRFENGS